MLTIQQLNTIQLYNTIQQFSTKMLTISVFQFQAFLASKCKFHKGQDLLFQCIERTCQTPVCEICVTDQHEQHQTQEIDTYIEIKSKEILAQAERYMSYIEKMRAFNTYLNKANSKIASIYQNAMESIEEDKRKQDSLIQWRIQTNVIMGKLVKEMQKHEKGIIHHATLVEEVQIETKTFRALDLVTATQKKSVELFEVDTAINVALQNVHRNDLLSSVSNCQHNLWSDITQQLRTLKADAFYPHLDKQIGTIITMSYKKLFLCSKVNGDFVIAGRNPTDKFQILLLNRLGELQWKKDPPDNWKRMDDMLEVVDKTGEKSLLCCEHIAQKIVKVPLTDTEAAEIVFEDKNIRPHRLTACPERHRLYVADVAKEKVTVHVLDTTSSPYTILPWVPLRIKYEPFELLYMPQTNSLLVGSYDMGSKKHLLAAIKVETGEVTWEITNLELRGMGLSLAPNGTILLPTVYSILLFNQEGQCIKEYEFEETAVISDVAWHEGFLIVLQPVLGMMHITAIQAPCPEKSTLKDDTVIKHPYLFDTIKFYQ